jgi:putative addiction module CopG family antidote
MKARTTAKSRQAFVNVSMPVPLRNRLTKKVQKLGSYGSMSDYIRDLIRRDLDRDAVLDQLDQLIAEGAHSPLERVDAAWWKARRDHLARYRRTRAEQKQSPRRQRA